MTTSEDEDDESFVMTVVDVTGEPLLGPRQASLIDALTHRLTYGPRLSRSDGDAIDVLAAALGLPIR